MAITLEQLQERLNGLQVGRQKQLEDLAVQDGAIGECKYWIEELQRKTPIEQNKPPDYDN